MIKLIKSFVCKSQDDDTRMYRKTCLFIKETPMVCRLTAPTGESFIAVMNAFSGLAMTYTRIDDPTLTMKIQEDANFDPNTTPIMIDDKWMVQYVDFEVLQKTIIVDYEQIQTDDQSVKFAFVIHKTGYDIIMSGANSGRIIVPTDCWFFAN